MWCHAPLLSRAGCRSLTCLPVSMLALVDPRCADTPGRDESGPRQGRRWGHENDLCQRNESSTVSFVQSSRNTSYGPSNVPVAMPANHVTTAGVMCALLRVQGGRKSRGYEHAQQKAGGGWAAACPPESQPNEFGAAQHAGPAEKCRVRAGQTGRGCGLPARLTFERDSPCGQKGDGDCLRKSAPREVNAARAR